MQDNDEDASAADEPSVEERFAATTQALQTIKEEGEEEDMQDPAETSKDAMLAQQLAAELEGGAYAQVQRPLLLSAQSLPYIHKASGRGYNSLDAAFLAIVSVDLALSMRSSPWLILVVTTCSADC